jgi:hypothetical protein
MNSSNNKVNDFLADIQSTFPDRFKTITVIQTLFLDEDNKLSDDIKYGGIAFSLENKLIGGIYVYRDHLSIEFSDGASFSDPSKLLEGKGKMRRHLKIREYADISTKDAQFFIKQAVNSH